MWLVLTRIRSGKSIAPSHIFQTSQVWNKTDTTKKHSIYPLPPKRCRSEREKREDLFSSVLLRLKKYLLPGNVKFNNLSISQSLKLRISMEKSFQFLSSQISYQILWVKSIELANAYQVHFVLLYFCSQVTKFSKIGGSNFFTSGGTTQEVMHLKINSVKRHVSAFNSNQYYTNRR